MSDNASTDPEIAGMGMLDLVDEVKRVRGQRDRLSDEIDDLANGPYYPEDVVRDRLRALLDDRTESE